MIAIGMTPMTEQYLVGELSLRLARLCEVAGRTGFERAVVQLRREAEVEPLGSLRRPLVHALALCDQLCWDSLARGEMSAFTSQVAVCVDLHDFGVCAGLLAE